MSDRVPEGWHTITPRLVVRDPAKQVRFLTEAFDATGEYRSEVPTVMKIGDSIVLISAGGDLREPKAAFLYLYVEDTDVSYHRALRAGAVSIEEPTETPYGDRRAMVTDPCGNDWQIATYAGSKPLR